MTVMRVPVVISPFLVRYFTIKYPQERFNKSSSLFEFVLLIKLIAQKKRGFREGIRKEEGERRMDEKGCIVRRSERRRRNEPNKEGVSSSHVFHIRRRDMPKGLLRYSIYMQMQKILQDVCLNRNIRIYMNAYSNLKTWEG